AFGLAQWARRSVRGQAVILIAAAGVFVVLATAAPFTTIRPAYTLDRYATWDDETPESGPQHAACFSEPGADHETLCMAYQTLDGSLRPGDFLKFSPAFTVTGTLSREWSIFIHLVNEDGTIEAQRDVYPGGGLIATSDLEVDDAWNNRIAVELPKGLYTPQTLDVYLGLYHLPTFDRMITAGSGADSLTNRVHLGQIRLETPPGSVPNPVSVNFGDKVKLLGYEITDRSLKPGEATMITLYWRALEKLDAEYVISIQVIDPDPARLNKAAQEDRPPAPSTLEWDEDDMITDNRTLTVVEDAVPGRYRLLVRVYPADDPANPLRVRGSTGAQSEDFVWLSWVQIEP
ncbi:MAG: hypothetical protein HY866_04505, partial [Chloroflexi bacterium]|nr:hypothetical protein [Chloroflexota bacterium]